MNIQKLVHLLLTILLFSFAGCEMHDENAYSKDPKHLTIITGSENKPLQEMMEQHAKEKGYHLAFRYEGSLKILDILQAKHGTKGGDENYDVVWPSQSIYLTDAQANHQVRDIKPIYTTYLALAIRPTSAEAMGLQGNELSTKQLVDLVRRGFKFGMGNPDQTNSGLMAYMGALHSMAGSQRVFQQSDLTNPELAKQAMELWAGVNLRESSNAALIERFRTSETSGIITYESAILNENRKLISEGRKPYKIFYLIDAPKAVDAPMGFVLHDVKEKEDNFKDLQDWMVSDEVQKEIVKRGFRAHAGGQIPPGSDTSLFNKEWGADINQQAKNIELPDLVTLRAALHSFRTSFGKPSYVIVCADFSGSMDSNGGAKQLKEGMKLLLNADSARENHIEIGQRDVLVFIPYADKVLDEQRLIGNSPADMQNFLNAILAREPEGNTDIYGTGIRAVNLMAGVPDLDKYVPMIVLMTDGKQTMPAKMEDLIAVWQKTHNEIWSPKQINVPIYTVGFGGDVDDKVLSSIASQTKGKYEDGHKNLVEAFSLIWASR